MRFWSEPDRTRRGKDLFDYAEFRISNGKFAVGVSDRISKPVFFDGVQFGKCQDALSCGNVGGH